jgi:hypothetical protein
VAKVSLAAVHLTGGELARMMLAWIREKLAKKTTPEEVTFRIWMIRIVATGAFIMWLLTKSS